MPVFDVVGAHAPAAVDQQHHALIALVLELAQDGLVLAQRGLPVDVAHRIAVAVLGELLEVGAFAALLVGLDADFLQPAVAREPGITRHLREVGVRAPRLGFAERVPAARSRPSTRADAQIGGRKVDFAAPRRHGLVGDVDALVGLQLDSAPAGRRCAGSGSQ